MEVSASSVIRDQLVDRREKLQAAMRATGERTELRQLLGEVDTALQRLDFGTYGLCESCQSPIEADRLLADPLVRFCLDHLSPVEQRSLEQDLELAARIQRGLLPPTDLFVDGWELGYHYQPSSVVSGDYCDVIPAADGGFHFMLGDVSGKGVAASMLMAHLHAMFRTLASLALPLPSLMERASRAFCESTLPTHYATLVCGHANAAGEVDLCNAGHVPPLLVRGGSVTRLGTSALPIGMFCSEAFTPERRLLAPGDGIVLYTDGLTEAENAGGEEYGLDRLAAAVAGWATIPPADLVSRCVRDVAAFAGRTRYADDLTMMAIRRR